MQPEKCQWPGCNSPAEHIHHLIYRSNGGTDDPENLRPFCPDHHRQFHSERGDWAIWGRIGGRCQQEHLTFLFTLRQFKDDPNRRLAWVMKNRPELEPYFRPSYA